MRYSAMKIYLLVFFVLCLISCSPWQRSSNAFVYDDTIPPPPIKNPFEQYHFHDPLLVQFQKSVPGFGRIDPEIIGEKTEAFRTIFQNSSKELSDSGFYIFYERHVLTSWKLNDRRVQDTTIYDSLAFVLHNPELIKLSSRITDYVVRLERNGYKLSESEQGPLIVPDYEYVKRNFYEYLTSVMTSYLDQLNQEDKTFSWTTRSFIIDSVTLIDRVVWWERFVKSNPDFLDRRMAAIRVEMYRRHLIEGKSNFPLYDDTNALSDYYRKAYNYLFEKYPETETAKLLKPYYSSLLEHDTTAIRKFQEDHLKHD
jgi:hypothetical protein